MGCGSSKVAPFDPKIDGAALKPSAAQSAAAVATPEKKPSVPLVNEQSQSSRSNAGSKKDLWVKGFLSTDPRRQLVDFFKAGDERGPFGYLRQMEQRPTGSPSSHFAVWRPTSLDALRMLFDGTATGKGLNVKGKSAKGGVLSGFVPFLQISTEEDKAKVGTSPVDARARIFFRSLQAREAVYERVSPVLKEMTGRAARAREQLTAWKAGELQLSDDEREGVLRAMLLECRPPTIDKLDKFASKSTYGLDLPERLLWEAYVTQQDIGHPDGWDTERPSEPAFMDLNLHATRDPSPSAPPVVIWQYDQINPMNPRGLLIAHEEEIGVKPVASDIDAFLIGSRGMPTAPPIPPDQVELVRWCLGKVESVLSAPKPQGWTKRWLEVLKDDKSSGNPMHPNMPPYGFGDSRSYDIMAKAVEKLNLSGAVRHGAECFNFYFPQELDEQFLVVWDGFPRYYGNKHVPWELVDQEGLKSFLLARLDEGYSFPLNPKWILCDAGFDEIFEKMDSRSDTRDSVDSWLPPGSGLRERLEHIKSTYPTRFAPVVQEGETVENIGYYQAEAELRRFEVLQRAKVKLRAVYRMNVAARSVAERRSQALAVEDSAGVEEIPTQ